MPVKISDERIQGDRWQWFLALTNGETGAPLDVSELTLDVACKRKPLSSSDLSVPVAIEVVSAEDGWIDVVALPADTTGVPSGSYRVEVDVSSDATAAPEDRETVWQCELLVREETVT